MDELGFYYYISGLDILAKYMLHIPEQYPVIAFIEKAAKEEIYNNLLAEGFEVIEPQYTKKMYEDAMLSGSHNMQVILYTTEDFQYSSEGLASRSLFCNNEKWISTIIARIGKNLSESQQIGKYR